MYPPTPLLKDRSSERRAVPATFRRIAENYSVNDARSFRMFPSLRHTPCLAAATRLPLSRILALLAIGRCVRVRCREAWFYVSEATQRLTQSRGQNDNSRINNGLAGRVWFPNVCTRPPTGTVSVDAQPACPGQREICALFQASRWRCNVLDIRWSR